MADLVMRALLIGPWKNAEDVEESLSLPELIRILKVDAERDWSQRKFLAALKGIELPDPQEKQVSTFDEIKRRAEARLAGKTEEELDFADIGIDYLG